MPLLKQRGINLKKKASRIRLTTSRIRAFLWLSKGQEPIAGFCFVSNMLTTSVNFYLPDRAAIGEQVRFAFESADAAAYRGIILSCNTYRISQGVGAKKPARFLITAKIRFGSEAERQRYLTYVDSVKHRTSIIKPGMEF